MPDAPATTPVTARTDSPAAGGASNTSPPPLPVLHVDASWIVVDKPAGLPSVAGRAEGLQDCAAQRALARFGDARVVHRLDMATSGLLVLARGADNQRRLCAAFEQRRVGKTYIALVAGEPRDDTGEIDLPLAADWPRRPRQIVDAQRGRHALTRWRVLERHAACSRLQLEPLTGRSHQLRVHLCAIGHPILGDTL
jgi:tRNA pseudouridine32 synthase/23S rRNA pseudouridine746 synthase